MFIVAAGGKRTSHPAQVEHQVSQRCTGGLGHGLDAVDQLGEALFSGA